MIIVGNFNSILWKTTPTIHIFTYDQSFRWGPLFAGSFETFFNVLFLFLVMIYLSLLKKCSSFRRLSLCLGKTIQESIQEEYWCHRVLNIKCWEVTLFSLFSDKVALDKWSENNTSTELLLNWCLTQLIFSVWYLLFRDIIFIKICCLFIPLTNHWIWWLHWLSLGCRWEK